MKLAEQLISRFLGECRTLRANWIPETAQQLRSHYLGEDDYFDVVAQEPYQRAKERISNLKDRGVDVEQHTLVRLNACTNVNKVIGIYMAARDEGMKSVMKAAAAKFKLMTGKNLKV